MPVDPHIIPRRASDPGAAQRLVDLERRIRSLEGKAGVVGTNAAITGPLIETAITGSRVFMVGPGYGFPVGLYCTDSFGTPTVSLVAGIGLSFITGGGVINRVNWANAGGVVQSDVVATATSGTQNIWQANIIDPVGAGNFALIELLADTLGGGISSVTAQCNASGITTFLTQTGQGFWPSSLHASAFIVVSDEKLKERVEEIGAAELEALHSLRPVSYYTTNPNNPHKHFGFVAQEVSQHLPELVKSVKTVKSRVKAIVDGEQEEVEAEFEDTIGVDNGAILAIAVAVIQNLQTRISKLEKGEH